MTQFIRPTLPLAARQPCADPVPLPDRDLSEGEATNLWGKDRAALRACEPRRAAAVAAVDNSKPTSEGGHQ